MPCDESFYYDFDAEQKITSWEVISRTETGFSVKSAFESAGGEQLLFSACQGTFLPADWPVVTRICLNGEWLELDQIASTAYMECCGSRYGCRVILAKGLNEIIAEGTGQASDLFSCIRIAFAPLPDTVSFPMPVARSFQFREKPLPIPMKSPATEGFTPGIGTEISPGRFAFSKGDGLLDCAMPTLGNVDKLYLCGHPRYQKNYRWNYSTLPAGASRHGSYPPANQGIENDEITVNHLSVSWKTRFDGNAFSCSYSLASPGIITENATGEMRLSQLEFAGNYQYALVPREDDRFEIVTLPTLQKNLKLGKNFILLFGSTEFPDLPFLLVFQQQPAGMEIEYTPENRLSALTFHSCQRLITATPFGIESFDPISPDDDAILQRLAQRSCFWSHALLAFPVRCQESYKVDKAKNQCQIRQEFSYKILEDEWNTDPCLLAPLPPVTTISILTESSPQEDFAFPTKYGYLRGSFGATSEYTIPLMPVKRKFPLRDTRSDEINQILKDGLSEYFQFMEQFPDTTQAYPYAGALMEPYASATTMLFFMDGAERQKLAAIAGDRLKKACDPDRSYDYAVINHGEFMAKVPDDKQLLEMYKETAEHMKLWNWYLRTEPFTKIQFHVCYLNLCFFSCGIIQKGTREEIAALTTPLVENDWGAGLTFYYMYLCALASGDFSPIREQWQLLRSIFSFFVKMHDWACCGSGYSDNGILWVEGANYGVYTSFVNMASALGDDESEAFGQYLAAKQFTLRSALLHASQEYFYKFYGVEPWYISKLFLEESNPSWQHQGVPQEMMGNRLRTDGIYNLTTEGLYPECIDAIRTVHPDVYKVLFGGYQEILHKNALPPPEHTWLDPQQCASMLIGLALDPAVSKEELCQEIQRIKEKNLLLTEWRGIHIFSRRLPKRYFEAQLLAWGEMKSHPLWLEHWQNVQILSAEWNGEAATLEIKAKEAGKILFGIRQIPTEITLNGNSLPFTIDDQVLTITPAENGLLKLQF